MQTLCAYSGASGHRNVVFVAVPDEPGLRLLFDVPSDAAATDDVVLVDECLTTVAEARIVALGWAVEHRLRNTLVNVTRRPDQRIGRPRELARYTIATGERRIVGQRVLGEVCVSDHPVDAGGPILEVQRGVATKAELDALVSEYVAESKRRGEPARRPPADLVADLAGALS
jgi:hypothetical protein